MAHEDIYTRPIEETEAVRIVETDIDLYWHMAYELYEVAETAAAEGRRVSCIVPVGPTFQYRRFVWLVHRRPVDLSGLRLYFMDEYLDDGALISEDSALSFRGFIRRELLDPLGGRLAPDQVRFPDPDDPGAYDEALADGGGAEVCFAGVGINGHLAFNEPPAYEDPDFRDAPTRIVDLTPHTITINSNTALGGAWDRIPPQAVTVGMKQILGSRRLMIYLNRSWQRAVVRKLLWGPITSTFPASYAQQHSNCVVTMTREVASPPEFGLR